MGLGAEDEPPRSLRDLAAAVEGRLTADGVNHRIRFRPPDDFTCWSMSVDLDDGSVDDLYANPTDAQIGVVPRNQESVSVPLAAEYVAMCAGLTTERRHGGGGCVKSSGLIVMLGASIGVAGGGRASDSTARYGTEHIRPRH